MASSRIALLAATIARDTAIIERYYLKQNLPLPSFESNAPLIFDIPPSEPTVVAAKDHVVAATHELHLLMKGPFDSITDVGLADSFVYHAILRFRVAEYLPVGSELSYERLSQKCGIQEITLRRILRFAMTNGFFAEPRSGFVAHSSRSRFLAENEAFRVCMAMTFEENFPAAAKATDALEQHPTSDEPTLCGWGLANQARAPFFQELHDRFPARHRTASVAMDAWNSFIPSSPLIDNYPWERANTVVDLGGGHGPVSLALAARTAAPKFIVQDLPAVIAHPPEIPAQLRHRIEFMAHDLFEPQPVHGADVYFFRSIFHDWPDKYCVRILQALIPALKPGARVVINDACMPPPGSLSDAANRVKRQWDMNMMFMFNALDREESDWARLFHTADARFRFQGVRKPTVNVEGIPPAWLLDIIEAIWEP